MNPFTPAVDGERFADGYLPFCHLVNRREQAAIELAQEPRRAARLSRLREIVFGAQDGIISTAVLTVTMSVAAPDHPGVVITAGIGSAAAGVMSMSAGAYLGSRAEQDVREAHVTAKVAQVQNQPATETEKLARLLLEAGQTPDQAYEQARHAAAVPGRLTALLLEKEYGITPDNGSSPLQDALAMGTSFGLAAMVPIAPLALSPTADTPAALASAGAAVGGLGLLGAVKALAVKKNPVRQALEIASIGILSAVAGYALGSGIPLLLQALGLD